MFQRAQKTALPALLCLATACLPAAEPPAADTQRAVVEEQQLGLVRARARDPRTTGLPVANLVVDAHFVTFRGVDRRRVMGALDLWMPEEQEGCVVVDDPGEAISRDLAIDLASAGRLGLSGAGAHLTAEPRAVPAFLPELSGYFYGGDGTPVPFAPGATYLVWAEGDEIAPFALPVVAPQTVRIRDISGRDPGSADVVELHHPATLDFTFDTTAAEVYVTVREAGDVSARSIQCRIAADQGVEFDAAGLDTVFDDEAPLEIIVRTISVAELPIDVGTATSVAVEYFDRVIVRR